MEILKKFKRSLVTLLLMGCVITAYSQDDLLNAFSESYTLEKNGEYAKSIEKLKTVYNEGSYETNLRLGWLSYQAGQFYESIAYYNKAIALMPYGIEARLGLAYPVYSLGRTDELITIYLKVLEIDPQNTTAGYRLGCVYYYKGNYEKAEACLEKVVNLFPFDYDSVLMLAWAKYKLAKSREARVLFGKALLYDPSSSSAKEGLQLSK